MKIIIFKLLNLSYLDNKLTLKCFPAANLNISSRVFKLNQVEHRLTNCASSEAERAGESITGSERAGLPRLYPTAAQHGERTV